MLTHDYQRLYMNDEREGQDQAKPNTAKPDTAKPEIA